MKYARVAKMSQNGGDRDRSRDWTLLQMPKCPIYIFLSKLGHFGICDLTWPNSCRIAKMPQKMRYFGICTSFGHVKVADAKMSQFCRENINGTFWNPWKCSITWPISVTAILGHFGNHGVRHCGPQFVGAEFISSHALIGYSRKAYLGTLAIWPPINFYQSLYTRKYPNIFSCFLISKYQFCPKWFFSRDHH